MATERHRRTQKENYTHKIIQQNSKHTILELQRYSNCQKHVTLKSAVGHGKAMRARIKPAPALLVIITQSVQNYDNCYKCPCASVWFRG